MELRSVIDIICLFKKESSMARSFSREAIKYLILFKSVNEFASFSQVTFAFNLFIPCAHWE